MKIHRKHRKNNSGSTVIENGYRTVPKFINGIRYCHWSLKIPCLVSCKEGQHFFKLYIFSYSSLYD